MSIKSYTNTESPKRPSEELLNKYLNHKGKRSCTKSLKREQEIKSKFSPKEEKKFTSLDNFSQIYSMT